MTCIRRRQIPSDFKGHRSAKTRSVVYARRRHSQGVSSCPGWVSRQRTLASHELGDAVIVMDEFVVPVRLMTAVVLPEFGADRNTSLISQPIADDWLSGPLTLPVLGHLAR